MSALALYFHVTSPFKINTKNPGSTCRWEVVLPVCEVLASKKYPDLNPSGPWLAKQQPTDSRCAH